ncbi:MAG TPA: TolC family protein [Vicinamibacterales bacterium]|nr:TolC family protein [Vicinamibacterales bacterium]
MLFISVSARAQTALTVRDAVRQALDRNLTLLAERYSVNVADARILAAGLRPNPVFTYNAMLPDSAIYDNNVNPIENVVRADVIIEGGGKRERRLDVAKQAKSVAEWQLLNTMRTIIADVQSAFVDVVLAKENATLAQQSLQAFNDLVRVNTERVRTGDLSQVELARSRLAALQFQNDVRQQEAKLAIARNKLRTLIGGSPTDPIDVTGDLRRDADDRPLETLRATALQQRPDLQAMRRDQARSTADIRLQLAQGTIDYTVSGEYHRQRAPIASGNQYGLYLSVPIPIFNRNQGEVERARQEEHQIEARIRALEADITTEVDAAYEAYAASRDVVATIERDMLAQARDVRTTTEYSYRRGEASFVELLDAVRAFNDTMQSYNEARAEYARSLYSLDSTTGASVTAAGPQVNP